MTQFRAFDSKAEVYGDVVLSFVNAMGAFRSMALEILAESGIQDPQSHLWYPQQAWLDAFAIIARRAGPNTLQQIGRQIPIQGHYPPGIDSIETVFETLDIAYRQSHRGGEVGFYKFEPIGTTSARIVCFNPYPCDFDRGLILSLAERFAPADALLDVRHEDGGYCKKAGADRCDYWLSW